MAHRLFPVEPQGNFTKTLVAVRSAVARAVWRSGLTAGLPKRIEVRLSSSEAILRLRARYLFTRGAGSCGVALFDLASWPYRAYLGNVVAGVGPEVKGSLLRYPLIHLDAGKECFCEFEFEWHASSPGTLWSLSQLLPEIALSPAHAASPSIALPEQLLTEGQDSPNAARIAVALSSKAGARDTSLDASTWVLLLPCRVFQVHEGRDDEIRVAYRVEAAVPQVVPPDRWRELSTILTATASATNRLLGTTVRDPFLLLLRRTELDQEAPGVVLFTEGQLQTLEPYSLSYEAARQIARAAWGAACRVHGRHSHEFEEAIGAAVAVRTAELVTGSQRSRTMLTRFRARAIRTALSQPWQRLLGFKEHRAVFRMAAHLLALSLEKGDGLFSHLTDVGWRRSSRTDHLLQTAEQFGSSKR